MFKSYLKYVYTILIAIAIIMFVTYSSKDIDSLDSKLNSNNVRSVFAYLKNKDYYESFTLNKNTLTIEISKNSDLDLVKNIEHDSAILFNILDDLSLIVMKDVRTYSFEFDHINTIFDYQLKEKRIFEIDRYYNHLLDHKYYLGNVNGIYNVYSDDYCGEDLYTIYTSDDYLYEMQCNYEMVTLVDKFNNKYQLIDSINRGLINPDDLINDNFNVYKKEI